jgi:hexosaminidase
VVGSQIYRGVSADGPAFFVMCGTRVSGPRPAPSAALTVTNATVPVRIGDPANGCAGTLFAGSVSLTGNLAVTFGANRVSTNTTVADNGEGGVVVRANTVYGTLDCTGNAPAPTNEGQVNTAGAKSGQCSGL